MLEEMLHYRGTIKIRRIPDWTPEEFQYWWCPEIDRAYGETYGHIIRPARISDDEKERLTEAVFENMLMVAGRTQILSYIGASGGNTTGFAKYLALGTGALMAPSPTDAHLLNEVVRKAQSSFAIQGTQVDINFQFAAGDAQTSITEAGLYGGAATGTKDSGTLYTHALFSYTKGNYSIACDYLANLF